MYVESRYLYIILVPSCLVGEINQKKRGGISVICRIIKPNQSAKIMPHTLNPQQGQTQIQSYFLGVEKDHTNHHLSHKKESENSSMIQHSTFIPNPQQDKTKIHSIDTEEKKYIKKQKSPENKPDDILFSENLLEITPSPQLERSEIQPVQNDAKKRDLQEVKPDDSFHSTQLTKVAPFPRIKNVESQSVVAGEEKKISKKRKLQKENSGKKKKKSSNSSKGKRGSTTSSNKTISSSQTKTKKSNSSSSKSECKSKSSKLFKASSSKQTVYQKSLKKLKRVKEIRKNNKKNRSQKDSSKSEDDGGKIICNAKIEGEEDFFWEMERVIGRRKNKGRIEYLIRWKGCPDSDSTWEPTENLCDTAMSDAHRYMKEQKKIEKRRKLSEKLLFSTEEVDIEKIIIEKQDQAFVEKQDQTPGEEQDQASIMKQNQSELSPSIKNEDKLVEDHDHDHVNTVLEEVKEDEGSIPYVENETEKQWKWDDESHVNFRPIMRIDVNSPHAKEIITEARVNGTPLVLTGHIGWANFAKRWLKKGKYNNMDTTIPTNRHNPRSKNNEKHIPITEDQVINLSNALDDDAATSCNEQKGKIEIQMVEKRNPLQTTKNEPHVISPNETLIIDETWTENKENVITKKKEESFCVKNSKEGDKGGLIKNIDLPKNSINKQSTDTITDSAMLNNEEYSCFKSDITPTLLNASLVNEQSSQTEISKNEKEADHGHDILIFTSFMMKHLEINNEKMHKAALSVFLECVELDTGDGVGSPSFASNLEIMLKKMLGSDLWKELNDSYEKQQKQQTYPNYDKVTNVPLDCISVSPTVQINTSRILLPHILEAPADESILNSIHCFARRNLEFFESSFEGNQIGVECIHCSKLPHDRRVKGSFSFPKSLSDIYNLIKFVKIPHFGVCHNLPSNVKKEFETLQGLKQTSNDEMMNQYYYSSALHIGLVNTKGSISFQSVVKSVSQSELGRHYSPEKEAQNLKCITTVQSNAKDKHYSNKNSHLSCLKRKDVGTSPLDLNSPELCIDRKEDAKFLKGTTSVQSSLQDQDYSQSNSHLPSLKNVNILTSPLGLISPSLHIDGNALKTNSVSNSTRNEGDIDKLLDLDKPLHYWELDIEKMIEDIGDEDVPVVKRNYNEQNPINGILGISKFLKSCWPSEETSATDNDALKVPVEQNQQSETRKNDKKPKTASYGSTKQTKFYLHQWQFPLSDTAGRKLCHQNEPLPGDIFGEDLVKYWLDLPQCKSDSPLQYLFMGREDTMSKLHKDNGGLAITIAPIVGEKECILVHRADGSNCLYHLDVKLNQINLYSHPLLSQARIWKSVIKPGEILLMPQGTYHQCRNVTPCLSYSRFHLDLVNLLPFYQSMLDGDAPELDHDAILWNCASELIRKIDISVDDAQDHVKKMTSIPCLNDETTRAVHTLRSMKYIIRELARCQSVRKEVKGYSRTKKVRRVDSLMDTSSSIDKNSATNNNQSEEWDHDYEMLVDDIDLCLHEFQYRRLRKIPTFRKRSVNKFVNGLTCSSKNRSSSAPIVAYDTKFDKAYLTLPNLIEKKNSNEKILSILDEIKIGHNILLKLQEKQAPAKVLEIETDLPVAYISFDDYPLLYDEFQTYDKLRLPNNGEKGMEIPAKLVKSGITVICLLTADNGKTDVSMFYFTLFLLILCYFSSKKLSSIVLLFTIRNIVVLCNTQDAKKC